MREPELRIPSTLKSTSTVATRLRKTFVRIYGPIFTTANCCFSIVPASFAEENRIRCIRCRPWIRRAIRFECSCECAKIGTDARLGRVLWIRGLALAAECDRLPSPCAECIRDDYIWLGYPAEERFIYEDETNTGCRSMLLVTSCICLLDRILLWLPDPTVTVSNRQ